MIFPLKMKENRVWRLYYGGKLIDKMRGYSYGDGEDGNFPRTGWLQLLLQITLTELTSPKEKA